MPLSLEALFHQNAWSTARLLDACEALDDAQLDAPAPGTAGTVRETLKHIVVAEQHYILRLGGEAPQPMLTASARPALDLLRDLSTRTGATLAAIAADAHPGWRVEGVTEFGVEFDTEGIVFLLQAANHGASHRQQVVTHLTTLGLVPEDLDEQIDAWSWGVATGALKTG